MLLREALNKCPSICHCERSEAILFFIMLRDCFVAKIAPRNDNLFRGSLGFDAKIEVAAAGRAPYYLVS